MSATVQPTPLLRASNVSAVWLLLRSAWSVDRGRTLGAMGIYPLGIIGIPLLGVGLKHATDALVAGDRHGALVGIGILVGALCGLYVLELLAWQYCVDLEDSVAFAVEQEIVSLSAVCQESSIWNGPNISIGCTCWTNRDGN